MTCDDVSTDLIGNLIYARSGWGDWAKRAKAAGLPGRTWTKGARVVEVMGAAHLTYAGSPRRTSELWHMLHKDKRVWLTRDDITRIDKDYARDVQAWFTALDRLRRYRT